MIKRKVYVVLMDKVWDFVRTNLSIDIYQNKEDARLHYWQLISESKTYIKQMADDGSDDWIEENLDNTWEVYLDGSWGECHITVMIFEIEIN